MRGYLLDTNHISAYFDQRPAFIRKLEASPPEYLFWVSAISLGENEASCLTTGRDGAAALSFRRFLRDTFLSDHDGNSLVLPIDETSSYDYARVLNCILQKYPFPRKKARTEHHLVTLGIDVNDVWIFATALKHNLTLLTTDKMAKIREAMQGDSVSVECWL